MIEVDFIEFASVPTSVTIVRGDDTSTASDQIIPLESSDSYRVLITGK